MWYKDAVIYSIDVETFMDSNGDGIGGFNGLTDRISGRTRGMPASRRRLRSALSGR
ncbi:hypothetical protein [Benzoatithermus flavus]|uniref:Uncharacterized protein n=1 Tax=Benzoatithermus flavus TaxID=3108223 RepID=A0ABU8XXM8_9PROT